MKQYRVFPVDNDDHIAAPAWEWVCENDQAATAFARELVHKYPKIEIWQGTRRLMMSDPISRPNAGPIEPASQAGEIYAVFGNAIRRS